MKIMEINRKRKWYDNIIIVIILSIGIMLGSEMLFTLINVPPLLNNTIVCLFGDNRFSEMFIEYFDFIFLWVGFIVVMLLIPSDRKLLKKLIPFKGNNNSKNIVLVLLLDLG